MRKPKKQNKPLNDLSRSLTPFDPNQTSNAVVELSKKTWLVAGIIPCVERQPLKKLTADEQELFKLLERWRAEAEKAGHKITRIVAMVALTAQPAEKRALELLGIEPVGLGTPMLAGHRHACRMNDVGLHAPCSQPTGQPEAVPAGLKGDGNAVDLVSRHCVLRR